MSWDYISGFFDADGSVTMVSHGRGKEKTFQISFHNNELSILQSIQSFILSELSISGTISKKLKTKANHNTAYDLKYVYLPKCFSIASKLSLKHPKKKYRLSLIKEIEAVTPRNGKYTQEIKNKREEIITKFFSL